MFAAILFLTVMSINYLLCQDIPDMSLNDIMQEKPCAKPPIVIQPVIIKLFRYPNQSRNAGTREQLKDLKIGDFLG